MKNQYHINSKLLAASGACAAGALLFFAVPATPALAEEMPVVVQEDATAGTVDQALTSAPQTTDQTIQDPDAQTASGTSSAITVTAGTDTDTATEPAQAASAASDPATESAVPAEPAAREAVAAAKQSRNLHSPRWRATRQKSMDREPGQRKSPRSLLPPDSRRTTAAARKAAMCRRQTPGPVSWTRLSIPSASRSPDSRKKTCRLPIRLNRKISGL